MHLENMTALVTGAASGIGRALALALHARSARLVLADRDLEPLRHLASEVGGRAVAMDVASAHANDRLAAVAGAPALLCLNAGVISTTTGPPWEASPEEWRRVLDINLGGVVNGLRSSSPPCSTTATSTGSSSRPRWLVWRHGREAAPTPPPSTPSSPWRSRPRWHSLTRRSRSPCSVQRWYGPGCPTTEPTPPRSQPRHWMRRDEDTSASRQASGRRQSPSVAVVSALAMHPRCQFRQPPPEPPPPGAHRILARARGPATPILSPVATNPHWFTDGHAESPCRGLAPRTRPRCHNRVS